MADLLIRYVNGKRTLAIDHGGPSRLEAVLHDQTRERRIPIPVELEAVPMSFWERAIDKGWRIG